MIKANISINLTKLGQNQAKISTSKKGEKWANLEIAVKDEVDQYNQNISVKFSKDKNNPDEAPIWLGNGSTYWTDGLTPKTSREMSQPAPKGANFEPAGEPNEVADDLPF
jgi:hypothetical protein|tara:strand:+ start:1125 stop:1454 length:330 start_codon:yes stop_codon:yes gene_type:complete